MQTSLPVFFSMMTTMPSPSSCGGINRRSVVCSGQLTRADVALADDLAQETFLKAYKNIRSFRGEAKFSTWLYRIAYNSYREDARRRKELVGIDETPARGRARPANR